MRSIGWCCILLITTTALAENPTLDKSEVRKAVQKSVAWLESDMRAWRTEHGCAACHHGPMYLWSVNVAKQQGYDVNEPQLREFTGWLLTDDEARIFPKAEKQTKEIASASNASERMTAAMMGHRNLSQPTIYLIQAVNAIPESDPLKKIGWQKTINHLVAAQTEDGSFAGRNAWRPIFNTPQILTRFVVTGLQDASAFSTTEAIPEKQRLLLRQAEKFLASQLPDETHQGIVLRILSEQKSSSHRSNAQSSGELAKLITQLKMRQRSDGGWSQTDDRESDAFATGQTLVALDRAGMSSTDPAILGGIEFLLHWQNSDGTWPMTSRPNPETGKPADFLNPITYAATAWATLGLTKYVSRNEQ